MDFTFVLMWSRAGMPSAPGISLQIPGVVGLGQVSHSPVQTNWPYLGELLGRSLPCHPPSLAGWLLAFHSQANLLTKAAISSTVHSSMVGTASSEHVAS